MIWIAMVVIAVLVGVIGGAAYYQSGGSVTGALPFALLCAIVIFVVEVIIALSFGFV